MSICFQCDSLPIVITGLLTGSWLQVGIVYIWLTSSAAYFILQTWDFSIIYPSYILVIFIYTMPRTGPGQLCATIHLLTSSLYTQFTYIIYVLLAALLVHFLTCFFTYLLPYLFPPSRTGPCHLQAGGRKRRPNLALVYCLFYVTVCLLQQPRHV